MQMKNLTEIDEEREYLGWLNRLDISRQFDLINGLVRKAGKDFSKIRKEILYGEQHKTLEDEKSQKMDLDCLNLSLDKAIQEYFNAWYAHDSFAYETLTDLEDIIESKHRITKTAREFLDNDRGIRVYVSANMPRILSNIGDELKKRLGREIIPCISSFEMFLVGQSKELSTEEFAKKYTYGDLCIAESERKKMYNPKNATVVDRIMLKQETNKKRFDNEMEDLYSKCDSETELMLRRFLRLSHWAGFEEPRKRYIIEGGIVDYLFRELVFQKYKNSIPEYRGFNFCLEINQKEFFRRVK